MQPAFQANALPSVFLNYCIREEPGAPSVSPYGIVRAGENRLCTTPPQVKLVVQTACWNTCFLIRKRRGGLTLSATGNPTAGNNPARPPLTKDNQLNMLLQNNSRMRHKFVRENGLFPKCVTSVLKSFPNHSLPSQIHLYSAPEARCTSSPSFFYRHTHPPYFATTIYIPVGPLSRYSRINESWSANGSTQPQTWRVFS